MAVLKWFLRLAPLWLPLLVIVFASAGLGSRLDHFDLDNLAFIGFATLICGLLPVAAMLGGMLCLAEYRGLPRRVLVLCANGLGVMVAVVSYQFGQAMYF